MRWRLTDLRLRLVLPIQSWCLNHPSRATWVVCELLRPLSLRRRLANAWWQIRHYNDYEAFDALFQTWHRSIPASRASEREATSSTTSAD